MNNEKHTAVKFLLVEVKISNIHVTNIPTQPALQTPAHSY